MKQRKNPFIRLFLTIILLIAGLALAYWSAFAKTREYLTENQKLHQQLKTIDQAPAQIAQAKQQLNRLDGLIGQSGTEQLREEKIVNQISAYIGEHPGISLYAFPSGHVFDNGDYTVHTYTICLQGNFKSLVKLLYYFENNHGIGKLSSIQFFMNKDRTTKTSHLQVKIYIQSFTKN